MEKTVLLVKSSGSRSKKDLGTPFNKTIPPEQRIIQRSRLINLLASNRDKKLILILGQAAQGKTTLAASYLTHHSQPHIWINLAAEDSDPVTLFYKLIQALQSAFQEKDLSALLDLPSQTMSPRPENLLYRGWIQATLKSTPAPLLLILDGLDRLPNQAPSRVFLQALIEEIPMGVQLFLLSRERPPLNIERWQMSQEAFTLTNEDLAFSFDEVTAFLRSGKKIPFSSDQVKRIHQYTQGWAGGLRILYELAGRHPDELTTHEGLTRILEGLTHRAFDYFTEELFSTLPGEMQELQ
jgi:LuxR family transcriptional regulator, maltose regulon positive regulatory protein